MVLEWIFYELPLKSILGVVFLFAKVIHPVVPSVPLFKEGFHLPERIPVKSLEVLAGETHGQDIICDVGEIQIVPIPLKSPFVLRYESLDGVLEGRGASYVHVLREDLDKSKSTGEQMLRGTSPRDFDFS